MGKQRRRSESPGVRWIKCYIVGLGVGTIGVLYGTVALLMGKTLLPGHRGDGLMVAGRSGFALALTYLLGGLYLLMRCYLEGRAQPTRGRPQLYVLENGVLLGFIGALIYVLLHVGEAG